MEQIMKVCISFKSWDEKTNQNIRNRRSTIHFEQPKRLSRSLEVSKQLTDCHGEAKDDHSTILMFKN